MSKPAVIKSTANPPFDLDSQQDGASSEDFVKGTFIAFIDKVAVEHGIHQFSIGKVSIKY